MLTKHVVVLPYDEQWKQDFLKIKAEIMPVLEKKLLELNMLEALRCRVYLQNQ